LNVFSGDHSRRDLVFVTGKAGGPRRQPGHAVPAGHFRDACLLVCIDRSPTLTSPTFRHPASHFPAIFSASQSHKCACQRPNTLFALANSLQFSRFSLIHTPVCPHFHLQLRSRGDSFTLHQAISKPRRGGIVPVRWHRSLVYPPLF